MFVFLAANLVIYNPWWCSNQPQSSRKWTHKDLIWVMNWYLDKTVRPMSFGYQQLDFFWKLQTITKDMLLSMKYYSFWIRNVLSCLDWWNEMRCVDKRTATPKTKSKNHLKNDGWKIMFLLKWSIFRGHSLVFGGASIHWFYLRNPTPSFHCQNSLRVSGEDMMRIKFAALAATLRQILPVSSFGLIPKWYSVGISCY